MKATIQKTAIALPLLIFSSSPSLSLATERPAWLPAEFNSPEELVRAYQKLNSEHKNAATTAHSKTPVKSETSKETESRFISATEESTPSPSDFSVSIGSKFWINNWSTGQLTPGTISSDPVAGNFIYTGNSYGGQSSLPLGEQVASIPMGNIRYKNFFITGSYYTPTAFGIAQQSEIQLNFPNIFGLSGKDTFAGTVKRSEWDVSLGWLFVPNLAFTVGYKEINMDIAYNVNHPVDYISEPYSYNPENTAISANNSIKGPTLGIAGSLPIMRIMKGSLGLYGSYAHGFMTTTLKYTLNGKASPTTNTDTDYDALEGGLTFSFGKELLPSFLPISKSSIFAGYRMQRVTVPKGYSVFNTGSAEITHGFTTGINLTY